MYLPSYNVSFKSIGRIAKIGSYQQPYYSEPIQIYLPKVVWNNKATVRKFVKSEYKDPVNIVITKNK